MTRLLLLLLTCAAPLAAQTYTDSLAFGDIGEDTAYGVAMDAQGNTWACGKLDGTVDIQPGASAYNITGFYAGYVASYDAARDVQWASVLEPVNPGDWVIPEMPAVDSSGNVYIAGRFYGSVDFDPGAGQAIEQATDQTGNPINCCAFLLKFDASGGFQWVRSFHGDWSWATRLAATDTRVCATGLYTGSCDLDPGAGTLDVTTAGASSFVVMLDSNGNLLWGDANDSPVLETATAPAILADGSVIFANGYAQSIDLGQGSGAPHLVCGGNVDMLIVRYDPAGALQWFKEIQGAGCNVVPTALSQNQQGDIYIAGTVRGDPDFDPDAGVVGTGLSTGDNSFVARYRNDGGLEWVRGFYSAQSVSAFACAGDATGVVVAGSMTGAADLNPAWTQAIHTLSTGGAFAVRLDFDGNYQWSVNFGGTTTGTGASNATQATTQVYGMAANGTGDLLLCGPFEGTGDFDPGAGTADLTAVAGRDGWMVWLNDADASQTPPLQIAASTLAQVIEGEPVSADFTALNADGACTWTLDLGSLPPGVTGIPGMGTPTVTAAGTTTASGLYNFRLRVTDGANNTATRDFTWKITSQGGTPPNPTDDRAHGSDGGGCVAGAGGTGLLALLALLLPLLWFSRRRTA
ncbi:MAG: hypothetical protein KDB82_13535 [Planctomycetes bacterium]|nr:hypothetical protein [Planctomycetota bacterium]